MVSILMVTAPVPRIGPNSVLQTLRALEESESPEVVGRVRRVVAPPGDWPPGMIPETWFTAVVRAIRADLPVSRSEDVLRRAGQYTAAYVGQRRIPAAFRRLLRVLPPRLSVPLLLVAFQRHAWTFAGNGQFSFRGPFPGSLTLAGCPTCRPASGAEFEGPAGAYYEAAFEGLLRLAAPGLRVREAACQAMHAPLCRFEISFHDATRAASAGKPCELS
jgi:divinyl protochlorophyllide a 8-vinyl-reductase